jgi:hypothetical protein
VVKEPSRKSAENAAIRVLREHLRRYTVATVKKNLTALLSAAP